MALLSVADMRGFTESDLTDDAMQLLLDEAEARIAAVAGSLEDQEIVFDARSTGRPHSDRLWLPRSASDVDAVTEKDSHDGTVTTLSANDYTFLNNRKLIRLDTGDNPSCRWANVVTVTYTPLDDTATRKRVQVDLVKMAIGFTGNERERYGDVTIDHGGQAARIAAALAPLKASGGQLPIY